jgi:uncharacterized protein (TIGR03000 family)
MYTMVLMAAMSGGADMPDCHRRNSCHGCYGGGCYGGAYYGGCRGGCYGGVSYGGGCYGGAYYGDGYYGGYPYRTMPPAKTPEKVPPPKGSGSEEQTAPPNREDLPPPETSARLIIAVPADATVFIDERPTTTTASQRTFATPALERGFRYYYTVRAEVVRNGALFTSTQRVSFGAGDQVRVNFSEQDMTSTVAQPIGQ